jgi:hypothetical protein
VLFDFDKPNSQNFIEPIMTIAHMARFVIADFTDSKIVLEEAPEIVRSTDSVPFQPLIFDGAGEEPVTIGNLRRNHLSVLATYRYPDTDGLLRMLKAHVIDPAEAKLRELRGRA